MTRDDFPVERKGADVRTEVSGDREEGEGDANGGGGRGTHRPNGSQAQQSFSSSRCRRSLQRVVEGERSGEGMSGEERIKGKGEGL